jgi:hypothetical protein|tara:strand:+ start:31382 stop:31879 length:498 start_codon:yes stop_codon:yes gene_type:complete
MSLATYIFKPKNGIEVATKVIDCFVDSFLGWGDYGAEWHIGELKDREGWYKLNADPSYDGGFEAFTEACFVNHHITGEQMTDDMMILLVEAGLTVGPDEAGYKPGEAEGEHFLMDVELSEVIAALSDENSHVYSPWDTDCWVLNVKTSESKRYDMTDLIFSLGST